MCKGDKKNREQSDNRQIPPTTIISGKWMVATRKWYEMDGGEVV